VKTVRERLRRALDKDKKNLKTHKVKPVFKDSTRHSTILMN
jgi:hypothetical protein